MLGNAATGLYKMAKQFAKIFTQVSQPLYKSIYPELTKLWGNRQVNEFKEIIKKFFIFNLLLWYHHLVWFFHCWQISNSIDRRGRVFGRAPNFIMVPCWCCDFHDSFSNYSRQYLQWGFLNCHLMYY